MMNDWKNDMTNLIIRLVVNALALWVASLIVNAFVPGGMYLTTQFPAIVIVVLIFAVVNALIKPIVSILTCPLTMLTLGLFTLVINALMLLLTSRIAGWLGNEEWLHFSSFWTALLASIVISIVSMVLSTVLSSED
jgi:putative membrane protein